MWGLCLAGVSDCSPPQRSPACEPGLETAERDFLLKNSSIDPGLYEFLQISLGSLS